MHFFGEVHHMEVEAEGPDHVDGIVHAQRVEGCIDLRFDLGVRRGAALARKRAQLLDELEGTRARVGTQDVSDDPPKVGNAGAQRCGGVRFAFDGAHFGSSEELPSAVRKSFAMAVQPIDDARVVRSGDALFVNDDCVAAARTHLPDASVDLIVTDPPYGIEGDRLHRHYNRDESFVVGGYVEVPAAEYNVFSHRWMREAARVLRPGGSLYVVSGYTRLFDVLDALRAAGLREVNHLIWKYNFGVYTTAKYVSSHYHVLFYEKPGGKRTFNTQARYRTDEVHAGGGSANYRDREDVWIINRDYKPGTRKNKNELPSALLRKIVQYSSNRGDLVCDFFLGGGSTGAVAIGLDRRFAGFEASADIFRSRVPSLCEIRPGELLATVAAPEARTVANAGRPWSPSDRARVAARFAELRATGATKSAAIEQIAAEYGRGSWSILRVLKNHDA